MKYGYIRPIEINDSIEEQHSKIKTIATDIKIYQEDHHQNKNRTALETLLECMNSEDELYVTDFFILADSTTQLSQIITDFEKYHIRLININKNIAVDSTYLASFNQMLDIIVDFERNLIRYKTKYGMSKAAQNGKAIGRPKRTDENMQRAIEMYLSKHYTLDQIKEETSISRSTLYRHLAR